MNASAAAPVPRLAKPVTDYCQAREQWFKDFLSWLRRLSANLRWRNTSKRSIKVQRKTCSWSDEYLFRGLEPTRTV